MLSLRNLHTPTTSRCKGSLDLDSVVTTYNLDGRKVDSSKNECCRLSFLVSFEQVERSYKKYNPECLSLEKYINRKSKSMIQNGDSALVMSYSKFKERYNRTEQLPEKQFYQCPFCRQTLRSLENLKRHKQICQNMKRKMRESKQLMMKKMKSIIQKSKLPSLKVKSKMSFQIKPGLQLKIKRNFHARLKQNLQKAGMNLKPKVKKRPPLPRNFNCPKCSESFVSAQTLDMHLRFDHRPRPTCSICHKVFECRRKLSEHVKTCTGKNDNMIKQNLGVVDILAPSKVFTCNKCENYFSNQDVLREHKLMANKRTPISVTLIKADKNDTDINGMMSPTTAASSSSSPSSERFDFKDFKVCIKNEPSVKLATSKLDEENICPYCYKEFQNSRRFNQHSAFCHVKADFLYSTWSVTRPARQPNTTTNNTKEPRQAANITCVICKMQFETHSKLMKHLPTVHTCKKYRKGLQCIHCTKVFVTMHKYLKHLTLHTRPNKCPICSFRHFKTEKLLKFHLQVFHKNSYCIKCNVRSILGVNHKCKKHQNTSGPKQMVPNRQQSDTIVCRKLLIDDWYESGVFACYICTQSFHHLPDLAMHLVSHHSPFYPYRCKHCMESFKRPDELVFHHKIDHNDETDYLGTSSIQHVWLKHSIVECRREPYCQERLFLGNEHLNYHQNEKHTSHAKLSKAFCSSDNACNFIFINSTNDISDGTHSNLSSSQTASLTCSQHKNNNIEEGLDHRSLFCIHVKITDEVPLSTCDNNLPATSSSINQFECRYCCRHFQRSALLWKHLKTCECRRASYNQVNGWNIVKIDDHDHDETDKSRYSNIQLSPTTYVKGESRQSMKDYLSSKHFKIRFETKITTRKRKKSLFHLSNSSGDNESIASNIDEQPAIKPAGPSLDAILSPDNKFNEKDEATTANDVISLQEVRDSLVPLDLSEVPTSPNEFKEVSVEVTDVMVDYPQLRKQIHRPDTVCFKSPTLRDKERDQDKKRITGPELCLKSPTRRDKEKGENKKRIHRPDSIYLQSSTPHSKRKIENKKRINGPDVCLKSPTHRGKEKDKNKKQIHGPDICLKSPSPKEKDEIERIRKNMTFESVKVDITYHDSTSKTTDEKTSNSNEVTSLTDVKSSDGSKQISSKHRTKRKKRIFIPKEAPQNTKDISTKTEDTVVADEMRVKLPTSNWIFPCQVCGVNFDTERSLAIHASIEHTAENARNLHTISSLSRLTQDSSIQESPSYAGAPAKPPLFIDITQRLFTTSSTPAERTTPSRKRKQSHPQQLVKSKKLKQKLKDDCTHQDRRTRYDKHSHNQEQTEDVFTDQSNHRVKGKVRTHRYGNDKQTHESHDGINRSDRFHQLSRPREEFVKDYTLDSQSQILPLQDMFSATHNNNNSIPQLDSKSLFAPIPLPRMPVNPTFPQWDRSAFDVWDVY